MHVPDPTDPPRRAPYGLPDGQERQRRSLGADLCARDPARWSAMVRYEDQLRRDGLSAEEARALAEAHFAAGDA